MQSRHFGHHFVPGPMARRGFMAGLAALGAASRLDAGREFKPHKDSTGPSPQSRPSDLKITKVETLQVTGKNWRKALYLKIHTDAGVAGL
jgi:hypothetical protein